MTTRHRVKRIEVDELEDWLNDDTILFKDVRGIIQPYEYMGVFVAPTVLVMWEEEIEDA